METWQRDRKTLQEGLSKTALAKLDAFADEAEQLVTEIFGKRVPFEKLNGADNMVLSFVTKQHEHLRSVRVLVAADLHRDAYLIARTMLEGMGRLIWAFRRSPERTDLWFWYGAVLDWLQIHENQKEGLLHDPDAVAALKAELDARSANYYRPAVQDAIANAKSSGVEYQIPENPWRNDWTKMAVSSMFDEIGAHDLYERTYREASEWVHWGPRAILGAMDRTDWGVEAFTQHDWRAAAQAMRLACQSLLQCLEALDLHFRLGYRETIAYLLDRLEGELNSLARNAVS